MTDIDVTRITEITDVRGIPVQPASSSLPAPVARVTSRLAATPFLGTIVGLVLVVVGFGLMALAWGKTAGILVVGRQLPWLMSAGLTGLGVLCLGLTAITVDAKVRDASRRREQSDEMRELLTELRTLLQEER